jgi:hypothetical protein
MGEGRKHHVGIPSKKSRVGLLEDQVAVSPQSRVKNVQPLPELSPGGDGGELDFRMLTKDSDQLETGVSRRSSYGDTYHTFPLHGIRTP